MTYTAIYIDVQPSHTSGALELLNGYRERTRSEAGNSSIDVLREISRANRFVVIEAWKDEDSFRAHESSAHVQDFRAALSLIHNSPYDQRVHHEFAVSTPTAATTGEQYCVVTHVDVPPPRKEETEVLLRALADDSRRGEGNIRYDIFQQNAPRTNHFTVFAIWKDENAFASYEMAPNTRKFREALGPMLGAPYDERLFRASLQ